MNPIEETVLFPHTTSTARVDSSSPGAWKLSIPSGNGSAYLWSQLDDYYHLPRSSFKWHPPSSVHLQARVSCSKLPGTWGFGFWNDPFGVGLISKGGGLRIPVMPNAVWFFYASEKNYLSLRNDLPAAGFLAASFRSPSLPAPLLLPTLLAAPALFWRPSARLLRRIISRIIQQDAVSLSHDPSTWHDYEIRWREKQVYLSVDGQTVLDSQVPPRGPLGFVLWIDNQYAAFTPDGRLASGTLPVDKAAILEISGLQISSGGKTFLN